MPVNESAASHQFVALPATRGVGLTVQGMSKLALACVAAMLIAIAPAMLGEAMAASIPLGSSARTAIEMGWVGGAFVAFLVGLVAFRWRRRRKIRICVTGDGLTVDRRRSDVYSFTDAQLGLWGPGSLTVGTALHLHHGPHSFVVGGRDHRLATGVRLDAPPVDCPDAWMSASDFGELLTVVGSGSRLDVRGPAPGEPIRCLLFPGEVMQAVMSWAFGEKLPFSSPPKPRLAIDAGADEIRVIDVRTNALKASAPRAKVAASAKTYIARLPRVTYTLPILELGMPGLPPMTIGCQECGSGAFGNLPRFPWNGRVEQVEFSWHLTQHLDPPAAYMVTGRDWLTLVEKFGLAPQLEDRAQRG
jgi:hypothetical protein